MYSSHYVILSHYQKNNFPIIVYYLLSNQNSNHIYTVRKRIKDSQEARFPIKTWNLYDRTLNSLPGTNNDVESWHSCFTQDTHLQFKNLDQNRVVEADVLFIDTGREIRYKCKRRKEKESRIYTMVSSYKDHSRLKFLEFMSLNLGSFELKKINLVPSYMYINTLFLINYYFGLILFCIDNK